MKSTFFVLIMGASLWVAGCGDGAVSGTGRGSSPDDNAPAVPEPGPGQQPVTPEAPGGPAPEAPSPSTPPSQEPQPPPTQEPPAGPELDSDGVVMLFPPNPLGSSWSLGKGDPTTVDSTYFDMNGDEATAGTEKGVAFWRTSGHKVSYASGAPDGVTVRLNIKAGGGAQQYTWDDGALEHGFLGSARDLRNLEATVYVRVNNPKGTHTSMTWKLRGGRHSSSNGALASCVGMEVPYEKDTPRAARELDHPNYDYINLTAKFPYRLQAGKWLGVKVVSYLVPNGSKNLLYLDTDPFDAQGKPRNDFRLYSEWSDQNGVKTGRYSQAATWAGFVTTFRVDGWNQVDFASLSAREILPPTAQ